MIVLILFVGDRTVISDLDLFFFRDHAGCRAVNDRLQSHFFKILHSKPDNPFKSKAIPDIDN